MCLTKLGGDPDHDSGVKPSQIGHDLTKVTVVGAFELVLDQHEIAVLGITGQYVCRKLIDGHLSAF